MGIKHSPNEAKAEIKQKKTSFYLVLRIFIHTFATAKLQLYIIYNIYLQFFYY